LDGVASEADGDVVDFGVFEVVGEGFGRDVREEVGVGQRRGRRYGGRSVWDGRVVLARDDVN
jgi:hypothetical protein